MSSMILEVGKELLKSGGLSLISNGIVAGLQNKNLMEGIGSAINSALDLGIKTIFPNFIGEQISNLKDKVFNSGIGEGLGKVVEGIIDTGKNVLGIQTEDFKSITDVKSAVNNSSTIDEISKLFDNSINKLEKNNTIDNNVAKKLKKEKNNIIKNVEKNIDNSFNTQINDMEKLENYMSNWNTHFENQDFKSMEKEFKSMQKIMKTLLPIENAINNYHKIENIQSLIKNNGGSFNLSQEQLDLAGKLIN